MFEKGGGNKSQKQNTKKGDAKIQKGKKNSEKMKGNTNKTQTTKKVETVFFKFDSDVRQGLLPYRNLYWRNHFVVCLPALQQFSLH